MIERSHDHFYSPTGYDAEPILGELECPTSSEGTSASEEEQLPLCKNRHQLCVRPIYPDAHQFWQVQINLMELGDVEFWDNEVSYNNQEDRRS